MKTIITIMVLAAALNAQVLRQGDTEAIVAPLGVPCEPGSLIFGLFPCPPVEAQGVLIHVRADDWRTGAWDSYSVTVRYRTAIRCETLTSFPPQEKCYGDESKTATATVKRKRDFGADWDDGWRAIGFNIGRVATGLLAGITVESVAVAKVPVPVVITVGETRIGAPK